MVTAPSDTITMEVPTGGPGEFRTALNAVNQNTTDVVNTVTFNISSPSIISLNGLLPLIHLPDGFSNRTLTIDGGNNMITGGSNFPGLYAVQGAVNISNLTVTGSSSTGGAGSRRGGGGLGAGGGIFIDAAQVLLSNVSITNNTATGGAGGNSISTAGGGGGGFFFGGIGGAPTGAPCGGGGGGGIGGAGGSVSSFAGRSGGGGGIAINASINNANGANNPSGIGNPGGGFGAAAAGGGALSAGGGGISNGGGSGGQVLGVGGYGGGGAGGNSDTIGFGGGFGGGGGGGHTGDGGGGNGGFGGGGGSSGGDVNSGNSGTGGFGGGGGGAGNSGIGQGGVGGGVGGLGGGGGAGLGGGIFVKSTTLYGGQAGSITINAPCTITGNTTTAGSAGTGGAAGNGFAISGNGIFVATGSGGANLTMNTLLGTITCTDSIADDSLFSIPSSPSYTPGSGLGLSLSVVGTGTLILGNATVSHTNTYAGSTHLGLSDSDSPTLVIGTGSEIPFGTGAKNQIIVTGHSAINPTQNASLPQAIMVNKGSFLSIVNAPTLTTTIGGVISGLGAFGVNNAKVTLQAINTYTGGTELLGPQATLTLMNGSLSPIGFITMNCSMSGTLDLSQAYNSALTVGGFAGNQQSTVILGTTAFSFGTGAPLLTYAGSISGMGTVTKQGSGTEVFSGVNTYTGLTTVSTGTLVVDGSLQSPVSVFGTLAGAGVIDNSITIESGGSIAPGNLLGTLSGMSLLLNSNSNTLILIEDTQNSLLAITNGATIAGNLSSFGSISYPTTYTILTAASITGTFDSIDLPLGYAIRYLSDAIQIYLENLTPFINQLFDFTIIQYFSMDNVQFAANNLLDTYMFTRKPSASSQVKVTPWIGGFGLYTKMDSKESPSFHTGNGALITAIEAQKGTALAGIGMGAGRSQIDEEENKSKIDQFFGLMYLSLRGNPVYSSSSALQPSVQGNFSLLGGLYRMDNQRFISQEEIIATSRPKGTFLTPHLSLSVWGSHLGLIASADWAHTWGQKFRERDAGTLNISEDAFRGSVLRCEIGAALRETIELPHGSITLFGKGSYVYKAMYDFDEIPFFFVDRDIPTIGTPTSIALAQLPKNYGLVEGEIRLHAHRGTFLSAGYKGEFTASFQSHQGMCSLGKTF